MRVRVAAACLVALAACGEPVPARTPIELRGTDASTWRYADGLVLSNVVVPAAPAEPGTSDDWFECVLLDPDREPVANQACEVTAPDGSIHRCHSDERGVVRLEALGTTGSCELRLVSGL